MLLWAADSHIIVLFTCWMTLNSLSFKEVAAQKGAYQGSQVKIQEQQQTIHLLPGHPQ